MTDPTRAGVTVEASRLWAGGAAAALVAGLIAVVGILLCRGVLDIPVLAPSREGAWGDADTVTYAVGSALVALAATGLIHLLLLSTPRPYTFFGWVMFLGTLTAVIAPFAVTADRDSQFATAGINLVLGIAIGSLVSGSARSATRLARRPQVPGRPLPPPSPYQRP